MKNFRLRCYITGQYISKAEDARIARELAHAWDTIKVRKMIDKKGTN